MILNLKIWVKNLCKTALRQGFWLVKFKSLFLRAGKIKRRKFKRGRQLKAQLKSAEPSVFFLKLSRYQGQLLAREIWPKRGRKGKLGVASLPKHKV